MIITHHRYCFVVWLPLTLMIITVACQFYAEVLYLLKFVTVNTGIIVCVVVACSQTGQSIRHSPSSLLPPRPPPEASSRYLYLVCNMAILLDNASIVLPCLSLFHLFDLSHRLMLHDTNIFAHHKADAIRLEGSTL